MAIQDGISSTNQNSTTSGLSLEFPIGYSTTSDIWMIFQRNKYSKESVTDSNSTPVAVGNPVTLPIPAGLIMDYNVSWDNVDLGATGKLISEAAGGFIKGVSEKYQKSNDFGGSLRAQIAEVGGSASPKDAGLNLLQSMGIDAAGDIDMLQKIGGEVGVARNPFKAALFNSPNFRNFTFEFKMIAKNEKESQTIASIIKEFRTGMSPSFNAILQNNIFDYPDMYKIIFSPKIKNLPRISYCVLIDVSVNYHGEGAAFYFDASDGKYASSIIMGLQFQEIEIITREKIEEGY